MNVIKKITGRVLVDTNVLIYSTLKGDSRHLVSREVLSLRYREDVEMFVSVQNLAEMYPNLTGPKNQPPDSPAVARDKIRSLSRLRGLTVLPLTLQGIDHALDLCVDGEVTRQKYFDRQLAALMIREEIPTIVTENTKGFLGIKGIKAVNPYL